PRLSSSSFFPYTTLFRSFFCLVSLATAVGCVRLARTLGASELAAAGAGIAFALMGLAIYFAPRAMSECASALPIVFGFALALKRSEEHTSELQSLAYLVC